MTDKKADTLEKNRALDHPLIRSAIAHFQPAELRFMDVPQWLDPEGKPWRIYFYPWTMEDKAWLMKASADPVVGFEVYADLILRKALDENANKLLHIDARSILLRQVDPAVLTAIANRITESRSFEEHLKN